MSFAEILVEQLNNPQCSMLSGVVLGEFFIVRWLFYLFIAIMIFQLINKLAWLPFIEWLEKKIYKKKRGKK